VSEVRSLLEVDDGERGYEPDLCSFEAILGEIKADMGGTLTGHWRSPLHSPEVVSRQTYLWSPLNGTGKLRRPAQRDGEVSFRIPVASLAFSLPQFDVSRRKRSSFNCLLSAFAGQAPRLLQGLHTALGNIQWLGAYYWIEAAANHVRKPLDLNSVNKGGEEPRQFVNIFSSG
jgi:hypothetical protein